MDCDRRFGGLYIRRVVAFGPLADISEVHSMDEGMISTDEIPVFLAHHANPRFAGQPSRWVVTGLNRVPTWDRVLTTGGDWINGVLQDPGLTFDQASFGRRTIAYSDITDIELNRSGWLSPHDEMVIQHRGGYPEQVRASGGEVRLEHFGTLQRHKLRNLRRIRPSLACLQSVSVAR